MSEELKPCINCGEPCDIFGIQLGDFATLTYLRLCNHECLFFVAYEYMHQIHEHRSFRSHLHYLMNEEDSVALQNYHDECHKRFEEYMRENPMPKDLLSYPATGLNVFVDSQPFPSAGQTMKFTRPTYEDRVKWQKEYLERQQTLFHEAQKQLDDLLKERQ